MSNPDLVGAIYRLLTRRPSGILSDIDGTLSHIVEDPATASVDTEIKEAFRCIADYANVVGFVSGRAARDAERMIGLEDVVYLGNHGMERVEGGRLVVAPEALESVAAIADALDAVRRQIDEPSLVIENKGVTGSIHYRGAERPDETRDRILQTLEPIARASNLRLTQGRMVIELRPPVSLNKGTALRQIVEEKRLRSIIFLGDDVTDFDAMRALAALRQAGTVDGLSVGVVDTESPVEIANFADVLVDGVEGVSAVLQQVCAILRGE
ncbi:MAG TPA: trehalose-phosphatase [Nitrolancea sp.]|jgi:trehalose 6-phosphate phosphatase|nr:trehalose-phosphatase [Nitrolancea sp.]